MQYARYLHRESRFQATFSIFYKSCVAHPLTDGILFILKKEVFKLTEAAAALRGLKSRKAVSEDKIEMKC